MIPNTYFHQQLAGAHRRDLLEAAEHARLAAQARQHPTTREPLRSVVRWRELRRRTAAEPSPRATSRPTAVTR